MKDTWTKLFACLSLQNAILEKAMGNRPNTIALPCYNRDTGDDRLRRERLAPDCEPIGAEIVKSAQKTSANRTEYAALPLAA